MNHPLLAPGLVSMLLCGVIVVALWDFTTRSYEQQALDEPLLPRSSQGKPRQPNDVVVVLQHKPPKGSSCGNAACEDVAHWRMQLRVADEATEGITPYPFPLRLARTQLSLAVAHCPQPRPGAFDSGASLSIRAPAAAPFGVVSEVLKEMYRVANRIELVVTSGHANSGEQRLEVPAPDYYLLSGRANSLDVVCISLQWDRAARTAVRLEELTRSWAVMVDPDNPPFRGCPMPRLVEVVDGVWVAEPTEQPKKRSFPCNAAGDAQLRSYVQQRLATSSTQNIEGCLEVAGDVPFQAVVDAIDAFRAAGMKNITFGLPPT